MPDEHRVYSEEEVRDLLRRARELQSGSGGRAETGLTIVELHEIAARVGIETQYVDAAAAGLGPASEETGRRYLLGGPLGVEVNRLLKRGDLTEDEWGAILDELRRAFETLGKAEQQGRTRTWGTGTNDLLEVQVVSQSRGDSTAIRVTRRFEGLIGVSAMVGSMTAILGTLFVVSALELPLAVELAAAAGGLSGLALAARGLYGRFTRRQQRMLSDLVARFEAITREGAPPVALRETDASEGAVAETLSTKTRREAQRQ